jgi:alpha-amylase
VTKTGDPKLIHIWRLMQTSDHFYYLCTKNWADGDVHKYFTPYKDWNPYENFVNFMNIIQDFKEEVGVVLMEKNAEKIENIATR